MKKALYFISLFTLPLASHADEYAAFQTRGLLGVNGVLSVEERFIYDFGEEERHGVVRIVPSVTPAGDLIAVDDVHVFGKDETLLESEVSVGGNTASIKIGDKETLVSGKQYYHVRYTEAGAARRQAFVWDVLPPTAENVARFSAEFHLPTRVPAGTVTIECYKIAASGESSSCIAVPHGAKGQVDGFSIDAKDLKNTGVRLILNYPKGYVLMPPLLPPHVIAAIAVTGLTLSFGVLYFMTRRHHGMIRRRILRMLKSKTDPEHFSFLARSMSETGVIDDRAVIAAIADLGARGYLALDPHPLPAGLGEFIDYSVALVTEEVPPGVDGLLFSKFLPSGTQSLAVWLRDVFPGMILDLETAAKADLSDEVLKKEKVDFPSLSGFIV